MRRRGYPNVSMKEIAATVGVSGPALYKHFANKQQLLGEAISLGLRAAELTAESSSEIGLAATVTALAAAAVDDRNLWMLLNREARHLDSECRADLTTRFGQLVDLLARLIVADQPGVGADRAQLSAQAVLAALSAPSQYDQTLACRPLSRVLAKAALRAAGPHEGRGSRIEARLFGQPFDPALHRREAILGAASALFADRGYDGVTLEEIGAAVSIAGPSIYNHFDGKADVLAGVIWRSIDWIESDLTQAMAIHRAPRAALSQIYADYCSIAVRHRDLFRVFTVEGVHLPPDQRDRVGRAHTHFIDRWVALRCACEPKVDAATARALVTASLSVVNDMADRAYYRGRSKRVCELRTIATAVAGIDA